MKSMSLLFLAAAGLALYLMSAGVGSGGRDVLVSSTISPDTWRRSCAFMGPGGVRRIEVEAHEDCESAPGPGPATPVHEARLAP